MSGERARDGFRVFATIVSAMAHDDERFARIASVVDTYALYIRAIDKRTNCVCKAIPPRVTAGFLLDFEKAFAELLNDETTLRRATLTRDFDFDAYEAQLIRLVQQYRQQQRRKRTGTRTSSARNDDDDNDAQQLEVLTRAHRQSSLTRMVLRLGVRGVVVVVARHCRLGAVF